MDRTSPDASAKLVWTEEARALVAPRRSHDVREPLPSDGAAVELVRSIFALRRKAIEAGVEHAAGEATALQQEVLAHLEDGRLSETAAAASMLLLTYEVDPRGESTGQAIAAAFIDAWIEAHGPAFAVQACAATALLGVRRHPVDRSLVLVRYPVMQVGEAHDRDVELRWKALRRRVATMPDSAYAEARRAASALREGAPLRLRVRLAYAFPDEAEWSADVARDVLSGKIRSLYKVVLRSLSDRELVEQIIAAEDGDAYDLAPCVFDIADALGVSAEAALLVIAGCPAFEMPYGLELHWRAAVAAVALLPTARAASWLVERLDDKVVRPAATALFASHPKLGVLALAERVASRGSKSGEHEAALLASIVRAAPDEAKSACAELEANAAKFVADLIEKSAVTDEASIADLPPVLASPPWVKSAGAKKGSSKKKSPPLLELAPLPFAEEVVSTDVSTANDDPADVAAALEAAGSPRAAPAMAHILARVKKQRRTAERWLVRHPRAAAIGLIPELLGKSSDARARDNARRALRFLASRGKQSIIDDVAREYGAAVVEALQSALSADSLAEGAPSKPPKMPSWFDPAMLPRPRLAGSRKSLPLEAVQRLGEMLAFVDPEEPYAGVEQVREACDAESLGEFAWGLFQAWSLAGYPMDEKWAFFAVGHLGRDEHAQRLAPLIRAWPSEGAFPRAIVGLDVLATMKSDVSLMLLHGISEKVKSRPLLARAREKLESVAESLGLSAEELADRLVPTLGLDDDGARVLDFGARTFRVGFDENLRPFVQEIARGQVGSRLAELPKPSKKDDAEIAARAYDEWKALKKAAKVVATQQIARFETNMIARRRWEPASFTSHLAGHPLVKHLVRRLVWGVYDARDVLVGTFRVAEDGSFADADDETFVVPEGTRIGIAHPLEIDSAVLAKWGERLSEYEIVQPFPQLGREIQRTTTTEEIGKLTPVDSLRLLGLERRGWRRGPVGDGGVVWQLEKEAGALRASLTIEPGLYAGDPKLYPTQTPRDVEFADARSGPTTEPDVIFLSEVAADLRAIGALA